MRLFAIDPGPERSAWVLYDADAGKPVTWNKVPNDQVLVALDGCGFKVHALAIEMVASYGMAVGVDVFQTVHWTGRFHERWFLGRPGPWTARPEPVHVYRRDVKLHLCGNQRAKDANIRQALIDRYGPGKEAAIGRKASPGPLYGLTKDCWSALAVAVTAAETMSLEAAA